MFSNDIGMEFGMKKCGVLKLKRGKVVESEGIELINGECYTLWCGLHAGNPVVKLYGYWARRESKAHIHGGIGRSRHVTFPASDRRKNTHSHSRLWLAGERTFSRLSKTLQVKYIIVITSF